MIINHNIAALNTHRQLATNTANQSKSIEKLSSGLRINRAGDDAAGLAISEKMRGQIRGLDQASRNAQDGISMIQTAEGALNETHSILQRMRELATQSANGTNTAEDRTAMQDEMNQLTSEINRIGNTTEFNTKKLLNGAVNTAAATATKVTGGAVATSVNLVATATKGSETGSAVSGTLSVHEATGASVTSGTGAPSLSDAGLDTAGTGTNLVIDADNNELTLTVDGTQKTIALTTATYNGTSATSANLVDDINDQLEAAFGAGKVTAAVDADGKLSLTSSVTGAASAISIDGGNAAEALFGANWSTDGTTEAAGEAANNTLTVTVNGVSKDLTLDAGDYDTTDATQMGNLKDDLQAKLDTAFGTGNATATWDATNKQMKIESASTGSTSTVEVSTAASSTASALLGFDASATKTAGLDKNNELSLNVDGTAVTVNLGTGDTNTNVIAANIQNAISTAGKSASVSYADGKLSIQTDTKGTAGDVTVTDDAAAKALGLSTSKGLTKAEGENAADNDLMFQIGANNGQGMSITIGDMRADALGISGTTASGATSVAGASFTATTSVTNGTDNTATEYALDLTDPSKSTAAIEVLDKAITSVSTERSKLGAYQNRLEHTINNLNTSSENLTAAESRIRDVDMAKEMMNQTKNSILAQASQAMLAQANQQPQGVLQLLR